nr:hypothetical protein [Leucobacter weissii]
MLHDLVEIMSDDDHRDVRLAELVHRLEERLALRLGERGGRLVEENALGIGCQGPQDLEHLLIRDGKIAAPRTAGWRHTDSSAESLIGLLHLPFAQPAARRYRLTQEDVGAGGEGWEHGELLVYGMDAPRLELAGGCARRFDAFNANRSFARRNPTCSHTEAGRFARTVLAHERMDLSPEGEIHRHLSHRPGLTERPRDVCELDEGLRTGVVRACYLHVNTPTRCYPVRWVGIRRPTGSGLPITV